MGGGIGGRRYILGGAVLGGRLYIFHHVKTILARIISAVRYVFHLTLLRCRLHPSISIFDFRFFSSAIISTNLLIGDRCLLMYRR